MPFSTKSICALCGGDFEQNTTGRKKEYCSKTCQETNKYLSAFESKFIKVLKMDKESKRVMRSKLMTIANLMNGK